MAPTTSTPLRRSSPQIPRLFIEGLTFDGAKKMGVLTTKFVVGAWGFPENSFFENFGVSPQSPRKIRRYQEICHCSSLRSLCGFVVNVLVANRNCHI